MLYNLNLRLHKGDVDSVIFWRYPDQPEDRMPRPTLLYHPNFVYADIYPEGVADMVGYSAEDRMLGGVLSFDRNDPNLTAIPDAEFPNAYGCHPAKASRFVSGSSEMINRKLLLLFF